MLTTAEERRAAELVLRAYKFSGAWDVTNNGPAEHLFLVDNSELSSVDLLEVEDALRRALPGKKVGVSPFKQVPNLARIY